MTNIENFNEVKNEIKDKLEELNYYLERIDSKENGFPNGRSYADVFKLMDEYYELSNNDKNFKYQLSRFRVQSRNLMQKALNDTNISSNALKELSTGILDSKALSSNDWSVNSCGNNLATICCNNLRGLELKDGLYIINKITNIISDKNKENSFNCSEDHFKISQLRRLYNSIKYYFIKEKINCEKLNEIESKYIIESDKDDNGKFNYFHIDSKNKDLENLRNLCLESSELLNKSVEIEPAVEKQANNYESAVLKSPTSSVSVVQAACISCNEDNKGASEIKEVIKKTDNKVKENQKPNFLKRFTRLFKSTKQNNERNKNDNIPTVLSPSLAISGICNCR